MSSIAALNILKPSSAHKGYDLEQAFPTVDPGIQPVGERVLVQVRRPPSHTAGGLIRPEDNRDLIQWNEQTAKVVAIGALAFKNKTNLEPWPEGQWAKVGDFIRIPLHKNDKWSVNIPGHASGEYVLFGTIRDVEVLGVITGDPLAIKTLL